jgi:hypothetical protein
MQATLASGGIELLHRSVARWGDVLVGRCRAAAGLCDPIYSDCDPANQQAVVEPDARQTISPNGAAARTVGCVARREKCAQCFGALAIPLPHNFDKIRVTRKATDGIKGAICDRHGTVCQLDNTLNPVPQKLPTR